MDKQLTIRGRAFGGKLETLSVTVDDRGVVRVWDDVAGYYTTCHSLSERDQARARAKASRMRGPEPRQVAPTYRKTARDAIPAHVRFDVPAANRGQIVEIAYAESYPRADEAGPGDAYKRVTDRSDGSVSYYVREGEGR